MPRCNFQPLCGDARGIFRGFGPCCWPVESSVPELLEPSGHSFLRLMGVQRGNGIFARLPHQGKSNNSWTTHQFQIGAEGMPKLVISDLAKLCSFHHRIDGGFELRLLEGNTYRTPKLLFTLAMHRQLDDMHPGRKPVELGPLIIQRQHPHVFIYFEGQLWLQVTVIDWGKLLGSQVMQEPMEIRIVEP